MNQLVNTESNKYNNGQIYKLQCKDNYYYIGSTTNDLKLRISNHKRDSIKYPDRKVYKHINTIGWECVIPILIESYPCNTKKELNEREDYYIQKAKNEKDFFCLNINNAYVSEEKRKQNMINYYEENKDEISEKHKKYREENQDKIKEYRDVYNKVFSQKRCEYQKKYVEENREKVLEGKHAYYEENKAVIAEKSKKYNETHKESIATMKKKWAEENKEKLTLQNKEYRENNKETIKLKGKEYYEKHKETIKVALKEYNEKNKDKIKEARRIYVLEHSETIECPCGGSYKTLNKGKHFRSKRHEKFSAAAVSSVTSSPAAVSSSLSSETSSPSV
jgi:hypothetical protein